MARHFIKYAPQGAQVEPSEEELVTQSRFIVDSSMFGVFVAEIDGELIAMFVAVIGPVWFSPSRLMASELAWWVEPKARNTPVAIRLLKFYEDWAKGKNAECVCMGSIETDKGPNVERMLNKLGYTKCETKYFKGVL
jgi:GNAT superfamily N-acetyltransferase